MRRTKGFTLIELLVVVAIIALLISILAPALTRARENAKRMMCGTNLYNIGSSLGIYVNNNSDQFPWIRDMKGDAAKATPTGTAHNTDPNLPTAQPNTQARCITGPLFLLVRDEQPPKLFVCPSDGTAKPDPITRDKANKDVFYWDFSGTATGASEHFISYSYQAPVVVNALYTSGVKPSTPTDVPIVADMAPTTEWKENGNPSLDWIATTDRELVKNGMSPNHYDGEYINYLYANSKTALGALRADVGRNNDNIYSACTSTTSHTDRSTSQSVSQADHKWEDDSFLIGPTKGLAARSQ